MASQTRRDVAQATQAGPSRPHPASNVPSGTVDDHRDEGNRDDEPHLMSPPPQGEHVDDDNHPSPTQTDPNARAASVDGGAQATNHDVFQCVRRDIVHLPHFLAKLRASAHSWRDWSAFLRADGVAALRLLLKAEDDLRPFVKYVIQWFVDHGESANIGDVMELTDKYGFAVGDAHYAVDRYLWERDIVDWDRQMTFSDFRCGFWVVATEAAMWKSTADVDHEIDRANEIYEEELRAREAAAVENNEQQAQARNAQTSAGAENAAADAIPQWIREQVATLPYFLSKLDPSRATCEVWEARFMADGAAALKKFERIAWSAFAMLNTAIDKYGKSARPGDFGTVRAMMEERGRARDNSRLVFQQWLGEELNSVHGSSMERSAMEPVLQLFVAQAAVWKGTDGISMLPPVVAPANRARGDLQREVVGHREGSEGGQVPPDAENVAPARAPTHRSEGGRNNRAARKPLGM